VVGLGETVPRKKLGGGSKKRNLSHNLETKKTLLNERERAGGGPK